MPGLPAVGATAQIVQRATSLLREDPRLVAAVAAAALVVLIVVAVLLRRTRRPPGAEFRRVLSKPDDVAVLMHPNPDPDAMATALGVAAIAEDAGTTAHIQYPGEIRHQENRAFETVLDLDCETVESAGEIADGPVVLVDHNEPRGFDGAEGVTPEAVVDHHPGEGRGAAFTDVRTDYGACASIVAEYFEEIGAEPAADGESEDDRLPTRVATGLLYGILADTGHLTRGCSRAEFEASAYLYPAIDEDDLDRIANPEIDAEVLDVRARAILDREVRGPFAVSDVGTLSNVDAIPQAADELLQLEGVTAVVVVGEKDGTLHLSGRSRDDRVHMGAALEDVTEGIPMSSAGGHARMGGGQLSVDHLHGLRPESGMSRDEFTDRLFDAMAGEL